MLTNCTMHFKFFSKFKPTGDQPAAIRQLTDWLKAGERHQTLLGVTGSGKTFTMAKVIEKLQRPTLVISPNKTLAAQLWSEFKQFFPNNAVHYFVSYYDYYQPEAYIPQTDTYIAKEAMINDEIDRLRHSATQSLLTRPDVIIVASVSCIYGLGSPENYRSLRLTVTEGQIISRQEFLRKLIALQYDRNDIDFRRGTLRARGEVVEVHPITGEDILRFEWEGSTLAHIILLPNALKKSPGASSVAHRLQSVDVFPAKHFVTPLSEQPNALEAIRRELTERLAVLKAEGKDIEAARLEQRTNYDLELIETTGYANGIENYSRHFDHRRAGDPPFTLLDYFNYAVHEHPPAGGPGWLTFLDESHIIVPQLRGMYAGDYSRKSMLVDYGWRLPSAFDNRPLNFQEFNSRVQQLVYVSATPNAYELKFSGAPCGLQDLRQTPYAQALRVAEQLVRPTGILDPEVIVRSTEGQLDDLIAEIRIRALKRERTLVTTITKRLAEELTEYLLEAGIKVQYLHSDVETFERVEILKSLRAGVYDVVVGINLLREGLDLPEVSLIAILDADKEGFLRNETTLIQTMGRAARHIDGQVIMYADVVTGSMRRAMAEVERRRAIQETYNKKHGIVPHAIERVEKVSIVSDPVAFDEDNSVLSFRTRRKIDKMKRKPYTRKRSGKG